MARPKAVGVLGGMGPAATLDLMAQVLRHTPRQREQDGIRLIVDSNPAVPDRNNAILRGGPSPAPVLAEMARGLEAAGAEFVVMACNTAHTFQFDVERAIGVPFVSMIEEAGDAVAALAQGPSVVVGLLAAEGCLEAGLYQAEFARRGLACVAPEGALRSEFMDLLYAIKSGDVGAQASARMAAIAAELQRHGAQILLGACTEVPLVLRPDATTIPLVDATDVLARAIVDYALERRALPPPFSWTETGPA
jgi:aspartate racemase